MLDIKILVKLSDNNNLEKIKENRLFPILDVSGLTN